MPGRAGVVSRSRLAAAGAGGPVARCRAAASLLLAGAAVAAHAADDCGAALRERDRLTARSEAYAVAFAPRPAPLATGRHFALDIVVCPRAGDALPTGLQVDADMPAHRHGMNYRASVEPRGSGRWRADGLLLHMPGRWRFVFELALDGRSLRVEREVDVP